MRPILTTLVVAAALLIGPAAAAEMTLEQVVARHVEARGGRDAWARIETIRCSGDYEAFSKEAPFTLHKKRDDRYHLDTLMNERRVVIGHDGETAWWENGFFGEGAQPIEGADLVAISRDFDFVNPLFEYRERGYEAEMVGETDYEGLPAIAIELTRDDGSEETWYLDPETHLEIARISPGSDFGQPMEQRTFFDDWRKVDGVMFPFFIETQWYTRVRVMRIETVETNVEVDETLFAMPVPPGMGPVLPLAGEWTIALSQRQGPGAPWEDSEGSGTAEALLRGGLVRGHNVSADGNEVFWDLAYDTHRDRYRMTRINSRQQYIDVLEGDFDEDGRLVLSNEGTGTTLEMMGMSILTRLAIFDIGRDGYRFEVENSIDGGESWMLLGKGEYRAAGS